MYSTLHYSAVHYSTLQYSTLQYCVVQLSSIVCPEFPNTNTLSLRRLIIWEFSALHCISFHFTSYYCSTFQCTALYCTILRCTVIYCTELYNTKLHHSTVQRYSLGSGPETNGSKDSIGRALAIIKGDIR